MVARRYKFVTFIKWWQIRSADNYKLLSKTEITSFTWVVVGWTGWNDIPWNRVVNVAVFKRPDMFTEFCGILVFCEAKWCNVISVSCLEVIFCQSNVCFRSVIVLMFDGCLVDDWWLEAVSIKWAFVLLLAVACFAVGCAIFSVISVLGWVQNTLVNNLFSVIHATVADFYGVTIP